MTKLVNKDYQFWLAANVSMPSTTATKIRKHLRQGELMEALGELYYNVNLFSHKATLVLQNKAKE